MDILHAIHSRRSVRQYTGEPVTEEEVRILLDAAMIAPSAGNAQPWHFLVVDDPALLAKIPDIHAYAGMAPKAAVSVLVCGDLDAEKYPGFWVQDCSAAMQNLLLAATGIGLGGVWTGIYPLEERVESFRRLFALPERVVPLGLAVIGRPAVEQGHKSRFNADKVHHNVWKRSWQGK